MNPARSYESVSELQLPAGCAEQVGQAPASSQQGDISLQCHAFKSKLFRKKRTCNVCHQTINTQGSSCRVCKYACHKSCEPKASSHCNESGGRERAGAGQRSRDPTPERYQGNQAWQIYHSHRQQEGAAAPSLQNDPLAKPRQPPTKPLPQGRLVAGRRSRERPGQTSMELNFVTQRVMALCFPPGVDAATYRENLREVAQMLQTKHGDSYMIFNLSERRPELSELHRQVAEYGWPETLAPPLDKLCSICKAIDSWTAAQPHNVAVLHSRGDSGDRGGWDRIGVVVSAYIHYFQHLPQYVNYFAGLLSGLIQINSSPLGLHHLVLVGSPQLRPAGGCRIFVRVYQGMVPVWTSAVYSVDDRAKYTVISRPQLRLT
ncbi:tensin-2-like [Pollicipes pollicipes]|uniref:tensin-2-like n=1 Tax=Pollicipes pollicipes TaxID=41117 RepID=UPI001884A64E|nr:tensin-2-like [Pollicipes pollicipes]